MPNTKRVEFKRQQGAALITLSRPDSLNTFDRPMLDGLADAFAKAAEDPEIKGAVITGAGRCFSAGADIALIATLPPETIREIARSAVNVFEMAETLGKPTVAAIHGYALGGGLELAEACMLRVASEDTVMGHPEVKLGAVAGWGGIARLPRLIGPGRAAEMLLTGKTVTAAEAFQLGLVNWVVEPEKLLEKAFELLDEVTSNAPHAVHLTWDIVRQVGCMTKGDAMMLGIEYFGRAAATEDFHEGTTAFLQKRKADFKGR
jgi:enoyl-CoA hydratase